MAVMMGTSEIWGKRFRGIPGKSESTEGVMDMKLVPGWTLVTKERSCGNFGDRAGSERREGGWRRRSGGQ